MRTIRTAIKKRAFLAALSAGSSVSAACRAADIGRSAAYGWRDADADFAAAWDAAFEDGTDRLEDELVRRALDASDACLIFALKGRRPQRWRGQPVPAVAVLDPELAKYAEDRRRMQAMTAEEIEAEIAELDRKMALGERNERRRFGALGVHTGGLIARMFLMKLRRMPSSTFLPQVSICASQTAQTHPHAC